MCWDRPGLRSAQKVLPEQTAPWDTADHRQRRDGDL